MDYAVIKKLIEEEIIVFDKLMLKNYKAIGISEIEAFILIELFNQKIKGETYISPKKLVKKLTIKEEKLLQVLEGLIVKKYVTIRLVKEKDNKETEDFSLDNTYNKLIDVYKNSIKHEIIDSNKEFKTPEESIVDLLENQFQKQLKPLEIELIQKWIYEDKYSVDEIKRAILDALRANRSTLSYVDNVLLKRGKKGKKNIKKKYNKDKSVALNTFYNSWDKK